MSNIIGNPFDSYVTNQISLRQSALGRYTNINADDLKFYTTKTPWLRLASSVNIEGEEGGNIPRDSVYWKLKEAGFTNGQIIGDNLAKNFILFGGAVSSYDVTRIENDGQKDTKYTLSKFYGENKGLNYGAISADTGETVRIGGIGGVSAQRLFTGAYGWGGVSERGYVPMPGIESAQTTYYNNGALSKATINIKCYSKAQFSLLDVLYLRPGYTLLLEFGHSVYINGRGDISYFDNFTSNPLEFLLNPSSFPGNQDQYRMFDLIREERKSYSGNYEAVYGKISNFKWSFNADGSYNISVDLIGMGSIMDSLKLNVTDPKKSSEGDKSSSPSSLSAYYREFWGEETANALLQPGAETIKLFNFNDRVQSRIRSVKIGGVQKFKIATSTSDSTVKQVKTWTKKQYEKRIKEDEEAAKLEESNSSINPLLNDKDATRLNKKFYQIYQKFVTINPETEGFSMAFVPRIEGVKNGGCYINNTYNGEANRDGSGLALKSGFIKFSVLLKLIEDNCNLFSKKNNKKSKLLRFDMSYGDGVTSDENYMLLIAPHLSTNPQICLVPFTKATIPGVISFNNKKDEYDIKTNGAINEMLTKNSDFLVEDNPNAGRLANLMINLRFAAGALKSSSKDSDGNISVISYVQTILQGVNEALGSINNFRVMSDDENGTVAIYDESPIPGVITKPQDYATFNIFGVKRGNVPTGADGQPENNAINGASQNTTGSFITNIGLDAEIPSNFATLISIGSQNSRDSGTNLQGNASTFANYNKGLVDRIIPTKLDAVEATKDNDKPKPIVEAKNTFKNKIFGFGINSPFQSVYSTVDPSGGNPSGGGGMYNFHPDTTRNFTENYSSYLKIIHGISAQRNLVPQPFFLPFNLNLEMDGLSGMKLFEKFRITDDILPPSYEKDSVDIIIKGINHNIDVNSWKTTLDTLSVPRFIGETKISGSEETIEATNDQQEQLEETATGEEANSPFQQYVKDTAWSAAFVSYVIKEAGVNFPYQGNHANYSQEVRVNGKSRAIPWAAKNPESSKIAVGDVVVFNRAGNNLTYTTPVWKGSSHGDIVTEVNREQGYIKVIGGNVGDTVKAKTFPIYKKNGRLKDPTNFYAVLRAGNSKFRKKIAAEAVKEHLNFASRKEWNPEVEDILYSYYQAGKLDAPNPQA